MTNITTISQKGQIVVPKEIRDQLNIKPSDTLKVNLEGKRIIVEKAETVEDFYGFIKAKKVITKKDIKNAYRKAVNEKHQK